ncbi:hypothetical protein V5O48_004748 [Marasmius crinis-equi]|uniref:F-box domain-containing protein n=1 Tax=Marasmius crinis-equi TaxID=585013 RepID=A0ABR3FPB0_9AGAR
MNYEQNHIRSNGESEAGLQNVTQGIGKRKREDLDGRDKSLVVQGKGSSSTSPHPPLLNIRFDIGSKKARKTEKMKRNKRGYLEIFLTKAPLDVMYRIFEQLPPRDLVTVSRINKCFYATLKDPSASTVWKSRRTEYAILPSPLSNEGRPLSDRAWLTLLFGGPYCQECGSNKGKALYVRYMTRLCDECVEAKCVTAEWLLDNPQNEFLLNNGDRVNDVLDLMIPMQGTFSLTPRSLAVDAALKGHPDALDAFFNRQELWDVLKQLMGCPTREQMLALVAVRKQLNSIQLHYEVACYRSLGQYQEREEEERRELILQKLLDCGYSISDFETIKDLPIVSRAIQNPITPRAWSQIKEPLFIYIHNHRLSLALTNPHNNETINARLKLLNTRLASLAHKFQFECPEYVPDLHDILRLRPVALLIAAPDSRVVTAEDFEDIEDELQDHVERMVLKREEKFLNDL